MVGLNTVGYGYNENTVGRDAFGRYRVSSPLTLFDSKQIFDNQPLFWDDQETSGSGTGSTHSTDRASTQLSVSASTAGTRVRQTFQRFNYQPGKSLLVLMTARMTETPGSGITARVGYFDGDNGVFMDVADGAIRVGLRSSVTGSAVDTVVTQSDWNGDKLDGTGPSGYTLNPTLSQILWFDFEWLGVGSVRFGFVIDGQFITAHILKHANIINSVYMSTPNLPLRFEISNDGTGGAVALECICSSVVVEGGLEELGSLRYKSTEGTHVDANTADTIYAIVGLRLKTGYLGETVNIETISMTNASNGDYEWLLVFNPTVAGTFTYSDESNGAVQSAVGATSNTVTGGTAITGGFIKAGSNAGSINISVRNALRLGAAIDGTRDEIVLCCRPLSANADIDAGITWRELS